VAASPCLSTKAASMARFHESRFDKIHNEDSSA
jgi:hypothetical protein